MRNVRVGPMSIARLAAAAVFAAATPAVAQNTTIVPGAETFSLPPGTPRATPIPTPSPTPTSAPTPVIPPVVVLPSAPTRTPAATPTARADTPATPRPTPTPSPRPAAPPTPTAPATSTSPDVAPVPSASPAPTAAPLPEPSPAAEPAEAAAAGGAPRWLWWLGGLLVAGGIGLLIRRRAAARRVEPIAYTPEPAAVPPSPGRTSAPAREPGGATATPIAPDGAPARAAAPVIGLDLRPRRLWTRGPDAHLAFELVVTNTGAVPLSAVRPAVALASAGPDTAAEVASFAAGVPTIAGGEPFDLRAGESRTLTGELTLTGDRMHVTTVSDREMIVPVALVGMAWRGGLSVASMAEAFVIGTGDSTAARLGPVWVDRAGQVFARLDARRFTPPRG